PDKKGQKEQGDDETETDKKKNHFHGVTSGFFHACGKWFSIKCPVHTPGSRAKAGLEGSSPELPFQRSNPSFRAASQVLPVVNAMMLRELKGIRMAATSGVSVPVTAKLSPIV